MAEESGPEKYAPPHRRPPANRSAAEDLNAAVRRIASMSFVEIDQIIRELESVREMMRNEGARVSREIAGYASLSHDGVTAMQVLADSIKEWRDGPDKSDSPSVSQHYRQQPLAPVQPAITAQPDLAAALPYRQQNDAMQQQPWIHRWRVWIPGPLANAVNWIAGEYTFAAVYRSTSLAIARWRKYSHSIRAPLNVWISAFGRSGSLGYPAARQNARTGRARAPGGLQSS